MSAEDQYSRGTDSPARADRPGEAVASRGQAKRREPGDAANAQGLSERDHAQDRAQDGAPRAGAVRGPERDHPRAGHEGMDRDARQAGHSQAKLARLVAAAGKGKERRAVMISDSRNQAEKQAMLARIRAANGPGASSPEAEGARDLAQIPRAFRRRGTLAMPERIELFQSILKHYGATSYVSPVATVASEAGRILNERGKKRLVVPPDFPPLWIPPGVEIIRDIGLSNDVLDKMDGVISGCTVAIASTGSIVVAGRPVARRGRPPRPASPHVTARSDEPRAGSAGCLLGFISLYF